MALRSSPPTVIMVPSNTATSMPRARGRQVPETLRDHLRGRVSQRCRVPRGGGWRSHRPPRTSTARVRYRGSVGAARTLLAESIAVSVALAVVLPPRPAEAKRKDGPTQITPQKRSGKARRQARRQDVDRSEAGTRRGILELSLGSVVLASSGLLIGRGAWEIVHANRTAEACAAGSDALECQLADTLDPRRGGFIAAGLSFGIAGVMGLAGGFLLARGVRINRDYREWTRANARVTLAPWVTVRRPSAGLGVRLRF